MKYGSLKEIVRPENHFQHENFFSYQLLLSMDHRSSRSICGSCLYNKIVIRVNSKVSKLMTVHIIFTTLSMTLIISVYFSSIVDFIWIHVTYCNTILFGKNIFFVTLS